MQHSGSGAKIEFTDKFVNKFIDDTEYFKESKLYSQYIWIKDMNKYFSYFPKIIRPYPNGYSMELLKDYDSLNNIISSNNFTQNEKLIFFKSILTCISEISNFEKYLELSRMHDFSLYIKRIESHIDYMIKNHLSLFSEYIKININKKEYKAVTIKDLNKIILELKKFKDYFNLETSNCHGDCTLENILINKQNDIKFIDSNYILNGWNSWLLDISKLFQSLHYDYEKLFYDNFEFNYFTKDEHLIINYNFEKNKNKEILFNYLKTTNIDYKMILLLEITHYIRMLKYKLKISEKDLIKAYMILSLLCNEYFKEN